jgi:hypothetical protein
MSRRRGKNDAAISIAPVYEGPQVLTALLAKAGSSNRAEDVLALFQRAQAAGEPRSAVIPTLFSDEPRFETPEDARRLYSNLFGLWARLAAGLGAHEDAPEVVAAPAAPPPLPERGALSGDVLTPDFVESVWKNLAAASPRELQRRRDRFQNAEPDVAAWLDSLPLANAAAVAAQDLAFDTWAMFDHAFGDRFGSVEYREVRALEKEPPPLESVQPALAAYVAEQLDVLADENPELTPEACAQVERTVATLAAAFTGAVREPS